MNGEEFLLVHKQDLYEQIISTVTTTPWDGLAFELKRHGWSPLNDRPSYFVKDRIAIEMKQDQCSVSSPELFASHLAFYVDDQIDVGIEILPMKSMQSQMSSGVAYYEGELYNVVRNGRGVPAVPLVIVGIDA